jgi:hypothetical protein
MYTLKDLLSDSAPSRDEPLRRKNKTDIFNIQIKETAWMNTPTHDPNERPSPDSDGAIPRSGESPRVGHHQYAVNQPT